MYIQWVTTHVYSIFIRLAIVAPPPKSAKFYENSTKAYSRSRSSVSHRSRCQSSACATSY